MPGTSEYELPPSVSALHSEAAVGGLAARSVKLPERILPMLDLVIESAAVPKYVALRWYSRYVPQSLIVSVVYGGPPYAKPCGGRRFDEPASRENS